MLQVSPEYVRLEIEHNVELAEIPEVMRTALQVCRLNDIGRALIVSDGDGLDLRAGIRAALRTMLARRILPRVALALVGKNAEALTGLRSVKALADAENISCEVFADEPAALAWLLPERGKTP